MLKKLLFLTLSSFILVPTAFAIPMVDCSDGQSYPSPYDHLVDLGVNPMATHQSLQSAIDDAQNGDIIAVCPGFYQGYVMIDGKELQLYGLGNIGSVSLANSQGLAPYDAALSIMNHSEVTLSNIGVRDTHYGLSISFSDVKVSNGHFTNNDTAVWIYHGSNVQVVSSEFKNNEAPSVGGAAIKAVGTEANPTVLRVNESDFEDNHTNGDGGAIFLLGDAAHYTTTGRSSGLIAQVLNSNFVNNSADSKGGSIATKYARLHLDHLTVDSSSAARGGAVYLNASVLLGNELTFSQNTAFQGGALSIEAPTNTTHIFNSSFTNNVATDLLGSGGGLDFYLPALSAVQLRMTGVSFVNNSSMNCSGAPIRDLGNNFSSDTTCF